jgi:hypothetical protein
MNYHEGHEVHEEGKNIKLYILVFVFLVVKFTAMHFSKVSWSAARHRTEHNPG